MTLALNQLFTTASGLPKFAPALGYRYFAPTVKVTPNTSDSQSIQQPTREATPSIVSASQPEAHKPTAPTLAQAQSQPEDVQTLFESFGQFVKYRDEYMDENPLVGEPGAFVFSSSKQHLQAQQQQAAAKVQASKLQIKLQEAATPQPSVPATPRPQNEVLPGKKSGKGSERIGGPPKPKRKKSKALTSPSSPSSTVASPS